MGRSSLGITYNTHNLRHIRISLVLKRGGGCSGACKKSAS
jgi:hypothetical protein